MMDAPAPAPDPFVQVVKRELVYFNILAILIDVIPFWVVTYGDLDTVDRFFSVKNLTLGAVMNYMLVCHILFSLDPKEHMDALFVSIVGMCLGTVCAFLCLLRKVVRVDARAARRDDARAARKTTKARHLMCILILSLAIGLSAVLYGMSQEFHVNEQEGWGLAIWILALGGTTLLNLIQLFEMLFGIWAKQRDIEADIYSLLMSFLSTVDCLFFVAYAHFLATYGSLFSVLSFVTAVCSMIGFVGFLVRMQ